MEMPIQVIVVLFIALVVGGAIIAFSQNTLRNAQQNLIDKFKSDPANKDDIITVDTATETTIVGLANECVKRNVGTVDQKVCFVIISNQWPATLSTMNEQLDNQFNLDTSGIVAHAFNSVILTYDPRGKVLVTN